MNDYLKQDESTASEVLSEWRRRRPEFTDEEWKEAMLELRAYLRIAWSVYRQQQPDLDLPDNL